MLTESHDKTAVCHKTQNNNKKNKKIELFGLNAERYVCMGVKLAQKNKITEHTVPKKHGGGIIMLRDARDREAFQS